MDMKYHFFPKVYFSHKLSRFYLFYLGEPHIDGEPGDLKFIIRIQK
jgi:hypothetical protein